jgi:hypothetical protein
MMPLPGFFQLQSSIFPASTKSCMMDFDSCNDLENDLDLCNWEYFTKTFDHDDILKEISVSTSQHHVGATLDECSTPITACMGDHATCSNTPLTVYVSNAPCRWPGSYPDQSNHLSMVAATESPVHLQVSAPRHCRGDHWSILPENEEMSVVVAKKKIYISPESGKEEHPQKSLLSPMTILVANTVNGKAFNRPLMALFDSGSDISLIQKRCVPDDIVMTTARKRLCGVNGKCVATDEVELQGLLLPELCPTRRIDLPLSTAIVDTNQ